MTDKTAAKNSVGQHKVFRFESEGIIIRSDFDSGNLGRAEMVTPSMLNLWTGPDCMGMTSENSCRSWFYFTATAPLDATIRFTFKNMNLLGKLFKEGMKPVVKTPWTDWQRIPGPVNYNVSAEQSNNFEISFAHQFKETQASFAFTFPWSYAESLALNQEIQAIAADNDIYFHKELLIYSLEHRRCDILTITSLKGKTEQLESDIGNIFPTRSSGPHRFSNKPIVFISARVHPGETPGSHAMNGFLRFIVSRDPRATALRDEFVFKLIPIINPDGVYRGHYRTDTQGLNLNRFYNNPTLSHHPTIFAIRQVFKHYNKTETIYCYIDLHAHANKRAVFIFGNYMDFPRQVQTCLLAKLLASNCANFDFDGSNFSEQNMVMREKRDGLSKEGSGRVALFRLTNVLRCYTLECNYNAGHVLNKLAKTGLQERPEADTDSHVYKQGKPSYTVGILEDVGLAIGVSLLDSILKNPYSRVLGEDPQLKGMRYKVALTVTKMVPFRFDSKLKKHLKSADGFQELMKGKPKKEDKEPEQPVKKKVAYRPRRIIKQRTEEVPKQVNSTAGSSSESYKSLDPRPKEVMVLAMKNFEFLGQEKLGRGKRNQKLPAINRVRKVKDDFSRAASIQPQRRIFTVAEVAE